MKAPKFRFHVDSVIMTVAGITLVTSLFFLLEDGYFFEGSDVSNLKAVGTFKSSSNDVRRRVDSGMTWSSVDEKETVYEGDSVFTGDKSEASIQLQDGTVLKVDPKSLVVIHTFGNKTEIDLQYGSLQGKIGGNNPIVIKENGKTQELGGAAGSQIRIVKSDSKATRVQVTKGSIKFGNEEVHVDDVIDLSEKQAKVQKATITLVSPSNGETQWLAMGAPLSFKWKAQGTAAGKPAKIEFSRSSRFEKTFYSANTSGDHFAVGDTNLPEGSFYWRVKPADGQASLPSLATAYLDIPPMPVLPKDQQAYNLDAEKGETAKTVFFTWEDKSGSLDYELVVARDAEFKSIVKSKIGKEKVERVAELAAGTYYWHVKGRHPDRENPPYSRLMTFAIKDGAKVPVGPQLNQQELTYTIPATLLSRIPASVVKSGRGVKPVNITPFAWTPVENAQSYEVEVALDEKFSNAVRHDNGTKTTFAPNEVRPGDLYVRIRARGSDGRVGPVSTAGHLAVQIPAPEIEHISPKTSTFQTPTELSKATHEFAIQWKPQHFASAYELQWGSDPEFTKSKSFQVKTTSRLLKVTKPDSYAARVRALDKDGNPISKFSAVEVAMFKKEMYTPPVVAKPAVQPRIPASVKLGGLNMALPLPHLREPASASALVSLEDAPTFVTFKWATYKGAMSYTIQISSDADFTNVVKEQHVKSNAYLFQKGLPEGKVFWRVRANTKTGTTNWSDPNSMNVIYQ